MNEKVTQASAVSALLPARFRGAGGIHLHALDVEIPRMDGPERDSATQERALQFSGRDFERVRRAHLSARRYLAIGGQ